MAGFGKMAFIGEYYGNSVVNVFHYRSAAWLPLQGNPFDDVQFMLDALVLRLKTTFLAAQSTNYTLLRAEMVGYDDSYNLVTSSPIVTTINEQGGLGALETTGAWVCANIGLRCGEQVQINGIGKSKRNRGYLAIGPVPEQSVDNYGHLVSGYRTVQLQPFADDVMASVVVATPAVTLIPIRIHQKFVGIGPLKTVLFRTYSDVLGYTIPRVASARRSRMPEA